MTSPSQPHVIQYARYSTPAQESGDSLARQEAVIAAFCKARGWEIAERVYDLGRSAWKGHHLSEGNLGELTRRVENGLLPVGTIIVAEKFDRFARLPRRDTQDWIRRMTAAGMQLALVDPGKVYDDNTSLVDDIEILLRAELAWQESQQKSERVLASKQRAWERAERKEGAWVMNSRIPGWLTVKPGRDGFDVDNDRERVVNDIYEWSADGIGAPGIVKRLNERGDLPWGDWRKGPQKWDTVTIRTILAHPAVEGDYVPGATAPKRSRKEEIKMSGRIVGYFPRIVDADLVERARAGVKARKLVGNRGKAGIANLFAGLVLCNECMGKAHLGWSSRSRKHYKYVRCDNAQRGRGCSNKAQFNYTHFERAALDHILHLAMDETSFESSDDMARIRIALADTRKAIAEAQARKDRWADEFEATNDPDARSRMREQTGIINTLNGEVARLEDELNTASGIVSDIEHLKRVHDIRASLDHPDPKIREQARAKVQRAIKSVVQMVIIDPHDTYECDEGRRTLTLILLTGVKAYKFDTSGNLLGDVVGHLPTAALEGGERIKPLLRRMAAA